jgi:hypothetical protein
VRSGTVHLLIEGGDAPPSLDATLVNGRVQVSAIKKYLDPYRLSLVSINGRLPEADSDGWCVDMYPPDSTLTIVAKPKPGVCGVRGVCRKTAFVGPAWAGQLHCTPCSTVLTAVVAGVTQQHLCP